MKLLLIRHGKTLENTSGIIMGQLPGTLSREAIEQAKKLRNKIIDYEIDAVYSSDLKRCTDTARILTSNTILTITLDPRLRKISFGAYQGKRYNAIQEDYTANMDLSFPKGESNNSMINRTIAAINDIFEKHRDQTVLVVTHSGPIAAIEAALNKISFRASVLRKADHNQILEYEISKRLVIPKN